MSKQESSLGATQDVDVLVNQLSSKDTIQRIEAREALVAIGSSAVASVSELSTAVDDHARWECAKTLAAIADDSSVDTLIKLLEDSEPGVRWNAGMGLIAIGKNAVAPLLHAIVQRSVDFTIIEGARHVMHEFSQTDWAEKLRPVYESLNSHEARESAALAAYNALQNWETP